MCSRCGSTSRLMIAGKALAGWILTTPGYEMTVTPEKARQGRQCVRLRAAGEPTKQQVAVLLRTLDATPYRGRSIRLRGALRIEPAGAEDRAQLWLRVDREGGKAGFFDNMDDRPVRQRDWGEAEIVGDVAPDATGDRLRAAALRRRPGLGRRPQPGGHGRGGRDAEGAGTAARGSGPGEPRRVHPAPRLRPPLPSQRRGGRSRLGRRGRRRRSRHRAGDERPRTWRGASRGSSSRWGRPSGSSRRAASRSSPRNWLRPAGAKAIVAWEHNGFGGGSLPAGTSMYRSQRRRWELAEGRRPEGAPDPSAPFRAELGGGVSCLVPLSLYADERGTLPHGSKAKSSTRGASPAGRSLLGRRSRDQAGRRGPRLERPAALLPVLRRREDRLARGPAPALRSAATDPDELAFLATLRQMVAALHDGHGGVYLPAAGASRAAARRWRGTGSNPSSSSRRSRSPTRRRAEARHQARRRREEDRRPHRRPRRWPMPNGLISAATPQWRRYRALQQLGTGDAGLGDRARGRRARQPARSGSGGSRRTGDPPSLARRRSRRSAPGIVYVDLGRIDDADFNEALPDLERARGIVFDFRGYPGRLSPQVLFAHLIDKVCTSPQWHIPLVRRTGWRADGIQAGDGLDAPSRQAPPHRADRVRDRRPGHQLRRVMPGHHRELQARRRSSAGPRPAPTATSTRSSCPGATRSSWTGMKVLKHDGSRHHGVGIIPTVPVSPDDRGRGRRPRRAPGEGHRGRRRPVTTGTAWACGQWAPRR